MSTPRLLALRGCRALYLEPYAYLSPAIPDTRPSAPGKYPRPGMVGENSYAHLQGCPLEETRPLIRVGAMILRIGLVSTHPRPRWGCPGRGMHTAPGKGGATELCDWPFAWIDQSLSLTAPLSPGITPHTRVSLTSTMRKSEPPR
ncbi:hypothetical protein Y032_0024g946 [Ancylostoma ceylanicum]|uniref:Uncharacterized protein n=1 Tax=Ancylostoma ceylanicum TaxID=53326 RepID=A0A016UXV5_9BILA|nr:hypothetical protein Y032_0024g946 [Ancylostoma ceylanicum]